MLLISTLLLFIAGVKTLSLENSESNSNDDEQKGWKGHKKEEKPCAAQGTILPHDESNTQFYRCVEGEATLESCNEDSRFDRDRLECVLRSHPQPEISQNVSQTNTETENNRSGMSQESKDICYKQVDGYYPNYTQRCAAYFRCQGGFSLGELSCPSNEAFDFASQECVLSSEVACTRPICHPEVDDFFWLPGTLCRSYYYCQTGTAMIFNCPADMVFDNNIKTCLPGGQCYEPICTGRVDGNHSDTTHNCQRWLKCTAGQVEQVSSCPRDTLHNGHFCYPAALVRCDPPQTTAVSVSTIQDDCRGYSDGAHVLPATECRSYQKCQDEKSVARFTCPLGRRFNGRSCQPEATVPCNDLCAGMRNGYHADKTQACRKYHYCRDGVTTLRRSCPDGTLFTGTICLPTPLVSCLITSSLPADPCLGLADGFHGDYFHGCTHYFYCSDHKIVLRAPCPGSKIWNGQQCAARKESLCQGPELSEDCHGRTSGLYPELASECENYFFCHNGNRTLLRCPKEKIFDGESCVEKKEYTCPSKEAKTCYNQSDGYRVDEESGCRAYYLCSNGHKSTYICPQYQVFNGTECVSDHDFSCPFRDNECNDKSDGYYADFTTRCRNYYFCEKGSKLNTLSCGLRQAFDGRRCVRTSNVDAVCAIAAL